MKIINEIYNFIIGNYEWFFSGIGVVILGWFIHRKSDSGNNVIQQNINANGDVVGRDKKS